VRMQKSIRPVLKAAMVLTAAACGVALAQTPGSDSPFVTASGGRNARFPVTDGKVIYEHVCQSCHMADGKGGKLSPAVYPALAGNARLAAKTYPAMMMVNGQGAMPAFGTLLGDAQIAAVANYVRTAFGNAYSDPLTAEEVRLLRPAAQNAPAELRGR
jgi:mono/diheme cytochrome c family protein